MNDHCSIIALRSKSLSRWQWALKEPHNTAAIHKTSSSVILLLTTYTAKQQRNLQVMAEVLRSLMATEPSKCTCKPLLQATVRLSLMRSQCLSPRRHQIRLWCHNAWLFEHVLIVLVKQYILIRVFSSTRTSAIELWDDISLFGNSMEKTSKSHETLVAYWNLMEQFPWEISLWKILFISYHIQSHASSEDWRGQGLVLPHFLLPSTLQNDLEWERALTRDNLISATNLTITIKHV